MSYPQEIVQDIQNRNIVFGYFQVPVISEIDLGKLDKVNHKMGSVCIAMKRPPKHSTEKEYLVAYSFCSPLDNFSKKTARTLALSRLASHVSNPNSTVVHKIKANSDDSLRDVFYKAIASLAGPLGEKIKKPNWLINSLYDGHIFFGRKSGFQKIIFAEEIQNIATHL